MSGHEALQRIRRRVAAVYGEGRADAIAADIRRLIGRHAGIPPRRAGWDQRDALLISYADTVLDPHRPPLATLHEFLAAHVGERFTFLHLLPFFPWTSDDGFAITDYRQVDLALGDWSDIERLAGRWRLVFDAVINHASAASAYLQGYLAGDPRFADFFIAPPPGADTSAVLRTRSLPLLHEYPAHDGPRRLWTTFGPDQVDLNFANPAVLIEILDVLLGYARRGASMLRLDAIPYLWKQPGTSCAHLPQTHDLIRLIRDVFDAAAPWVLLLTETNVPHEQNVSYFGDRGDEAQMIYNFSLPPLVLDALLTGEAGTLSAWAAGIGHIGSRATYLNITATHDGIGMRPTEGILPEPRRRELVEMAYAHQGDVTGKRNADGTLSPYELNLNYFDAVNDPTADEPLDTQIARFLASQAIPLSFIGMPGVYIHSLLGSRNDMEGVRRTGRARAINRAKLPLAALEAELADPSSLRSRVLGEYLRMLDMRRRQSAFHPDASQQVLELGGGVFAIRRRNGQTGQQIVAVHNMTDTRLRVAAEAGVDLLDERSQCSAAVALAPYQVRWIETAPAES
jgi:glycosidase